ncbi:hypothetical protein BZG02_04905 [Labilibaculum filiforme]|uniref:Uncharacterized protein n=1 Tax=Labilibaculum filiforme TaxID=1940526 RepID=A0A2N3I4D3_9BACT|nr:hypothetical protein [Labilibaculum filiforme]PKQ65169.1 hypothetical protein BZG02_04905 [Labilibaculum filiforme]
MKSLYKLLMVFVGVLMFTNTQAQNTGTTPFAGSTHRYTITKGSIATTTLAWSVTTGSNGTQFNYKTALDGTYVDIEWLVDGDYIVQVVESRTDVGFACPTVRQIAVKVGTNTFDVFAELVSATEECATVLSPVDDADVLGDNSTDIFGTTSRDFKVKMTGGDNTKKWSFDYALTDIAGSFNLGDVTAVSITDGTATGNNVVVAAGVSEVTFSISYSTNKNTAGVNGQDTDFTMELAVSNAKDELGTPDSETGDASNKVSYIVKAVPATTGITTD